MNTPVSAREQQKSQLRDMLSALDSGDDALYETRLVQFMRDRETGLFVSVARLTRELHQAIFDAKLDGQLTSMAQSDIPDACSRLDYVVTLTEEAAHKTLDLVEHGRASLKRIQQAGGMIAALPQQATLAQAHALLSGGVEELRGQLSQLAQAQEYQDLSGQLIKRVIRLVRGVEAALLELLKAAGPLQNLAAAPIPTATAPAAGSSLQGPAVPGLGGAQVSQQDADALLSSLGF